MVAEPARIGLYVHELAHTGVVRNTRAVAQALADDGHWVDIVTAIPGGKPPDGVAHVSLLRRAGRSRAFEHVAAVPALRRYLRGERLDLLVSMGNHGHATVWAATLGRRAAKLVYRISNDLTREMPGAPRGGMLKRLLRPRFTELLVKSADALVLVSPSLAADPILKAALAEGKAKVIVNGVDVAEARRRAAEPPPKDWPEGDEPTVIAIGRLAAQKNYPTLLRAIAKLNKDRPVRLAILGESRDDARTSLSSQAAELGIGKELLLPGTTDNVFAWLARADVFALPSWWEGSPNVLLEAIAVGTPVAASRTAGNAADIVGDRYGRLFDPNDVEAMAEAIRLQLSSETRLLPEQRAEEYDIARTLNEWRAFVRNLLGGRR